MEHVQPNTLTLGDAGLVTTRKAAAMRDTAPHCSVECVKDVVSLQAHKAAMTELAEASLEPALCTEFAWCDAGLRHLARHAGDDWVLLVWRHEEAECGRKLIGAFVQTKPRRMVPSIFRQARLSAHLLGPLGTPLIHRDHGAEALRAYFSWTFGKGGGAANVIWRNVPAGGPLAAALEDLGQGNVLRSSRINPCRRAVYEVADDVDAYLNRTLPRKKRKELRRLRARLSEQGTLTLEQYPVGGDLAPWLDDFYGLEARGWKGRAKTAIASVPSLTRFFDRALSSIDERGGLLFWKLCIDGVPIAMTFGARSGRHAWLCKIAYDEDYSRFSPGVLLVLDVMGILAADSGIEVIDSCAQPDHPMIDHLWRERLELADIVIARPGQPRLLFAAVCRYAAAKHQAREAAKRIYKKFLKGGRK